jgi:hypothetical protein
MNNSYLLKIDCALELLAGSMNVLFTGMPDVNATVLGRATLKWDFGLLGVEVTKKCIIQSFKICSYRVTLSMQLDPNGS